MSTRQVEASFRPRWWLRGPHHQSVLPSLPLRRAAVRRAARALLETSRELRLDCGDGTVLQAFHAPPLVPPARGVPTLAVLLHGWEGSADSLYVLTLARRLHAHGYDVVRLNLRDHGDTHHLNRDLFHSCRLPEVVGAVARLQAGFPAHRMVLAGFSLGGNFMLRVAAEAPRASLRIARALAVSPVLDPARTLEALESGLWIYPRYFVLKWSRSLRRKQRAWPGEFDFDPLLRARDLRRMTADLVRAHTEYRDLESYLAGYAITGTRLAGLEVPSTILTALDDPMIPARDLDLLPREPRLRVVVTEHGGHCGFLETLGPSSWVDEFALAEFEREREHDAAGAPAPAPIAAAATATSTASTGVSAPATPATGLAGAA